MSGYNLLRASDGTGNAVLAHIESPRGIGATVLDVDSLDNWPTEFIVVTGNLNANGFLIPSTMTEMLAHQDAGNIIIDGYAPGYTDKGNTADQVAVLKPTSHIFDSLVENAQREHKNDGKHANVTADSVILNNGQDLSQQSLYQNAIINGSCIVAQRAVPNISNVYQYGRVDRFAARATGTAVSAGTINQNTSSLVAAEKGYEIKLAGVTVTGTGIVYIRYRIEARDAVLFANKAASFACRVHHDVGASVNATIFIRKPTVADNFTSVTDIANSGAIAVPNNTGTTIKFENINSGNLGDVSNGLEIEIQIACGAVTTKNFSFGDFQFNLGSKAAPFQPRAFETELKACERYYEKSYEYATAPGTASTSRGQNTSFASSASDVYMPQSYYKTRKRVIPTFVSWNPVTGASGSARNGAASTNITPTISAVECSEIKNYVYFTAGVAAGQQINWHWTADAEL